MLWGAIIEKPKNQNRYNERNDDKVAAYEDWRINGVNVLGRGSPGVRWEYAIPSAIPSRSLINTNDSLCLEWAKTLLNIGIL